MLMILEIAVLYIVTQNNHPVMCYSLITLQESFF